LQQLFREQKRLLAAKFNTDLFVIICNTKERGGRVSGGSKGMKYISTRNKTKKVIGAEALVSGISEEGGLFVPESLPKLTIADKDRLAGCDYGERAAFILSKFLPEFGYEELLAVSKEAYSAFDDGDPAPVVKVDKRLYMLELWHGPTLAFKDMALTVLPGLLKLCKRKLGIREKTLILVATSGDTGKAALSGFRDAEGVEICVFYPSDGVSGMQKLQMTTQEGGNVAVFGVKGNFDDCQTNVKKVFASRDIAAYAKEKGYAFSSANSINWGRLLPQIAYYVSAYLDLIGENQIEKGDGINFCVPTGNFGNILAAYYARGMGIPIRKLICASNTNNVLTDFFNKGEYSLKRSFVKTMSPSMDILVSSNLERLRCEVSGRNDKLTAERIAALSESGKYALTEGERTALSELFYADYLNEDDTVETVQDFFDEYNYPLDPHTGVAVGVYNKYVAKTQDKTKTVIVSTASPYKFPQDVLFSITGDYCGDSFRAAKKLYKETALDIPGSLMALKTMPVRFKQVIAGADIAETVKGLM
jgi:threonine synthase